MKYSKNAYSLSLPHKNVYFFCSSETDHVMAALNVIVKTCMENLAVIWDESGYSKSSIQQRCEAVKKHVQMNVVLGTSFI
jgi:hypothetical protein